MKQNYKSVDVNPIDFKEQFLFIQLRIDGVRLKVIIIVYIFLYALKLIVDQTNIVSLVHV